MIGTLYRALLEAIVLLLLLCVVVRVLV